MRRKHSMRASFPNRLDLNQAARGAIELGRSPAAAVVSGGWMNCAHLVQLNNTPRTCPPLSLDSPVKWFVVSGEELTRDAYDCGASVVVRSCITHTTTSRTVDQALDLPSDTATVIYVSLVSRCRRRHGGRNRKGYGYRGLCDASSRHVYDSRMCATRCCVGFVEFLD